MYRVDNMKVKCLKKVLPVSLRLNTSGLYYPDTIGQNCNFKNLNHHSIVSHARMKSNEFFLSNFGQKIFLWLPFSRAHMNELNLD